MTTHVIDITVKMRLVFDGPFEKLPCGTEVVGIAAKALAREKGISFRLGKGVATVSALNGIGPHCIICGKGSRNGIPPASWQATDDGGFFCKSCKPRPFDL